MSKKVIAYHGSPRDFDKFDSKYMSSTGASDGYGFYFTTSKANAKMFMEDGGVLLTCEIDVNGILNANKVTIPKDELVKIIGELDAATDGDFLSNYGDVNRMGYSKVMQECISNTLEYSNSDVDIFGEFVNIVGNFDMTASAFINVGYNTQLIDKPRWGAEPHKVLVVIDPNAITILDKEQVVNTNESYRAKFVYNFIK